MNRYDDAVNDGNHRYNKINSGIIVSAEAL